MTNTLHANGQLLPGQRLTSLNGLYWIVLAQDGNLVLYNHQDNPCWASATDGKAAKHCIMQPDGNLVIYDYNGDRLWASNTYNNPDASLVVQDDGNVVIYRHGDKRKLWATDTAV